MVCLVQVPLDFVKPTLLTRPSPCDVYAALHDRLERILTQPNIAPIPTQYMSVVLIPETVIHSCLTGTSIGQATIRYFMLTH